MVENIEITSAEWRIMRVIWTLGQATSTQIIEELQNKWKPSTIKTLLRRLVGKNIILANKEGRYFVYKPEVMEQKTMDKAADELFGDFCNMHVGETIAHVVNGVELSQSDIIKLQKILQKKLKTAPKSVACNCLSCEMKEA